MIDVIFLIIFFVCWGGIIFIISRKLFFLSILNVPKISGGGKVAKIRGKIIRCFESGLIYLKNTIKLIKKKRKLYR